MKKNAFVSLNVIFFTVTYTVMSYGLPIIPGPTQYLLIGAFTLCASWAWLTKISVKSDFSQMPPSRSGFDSERGAFRVNLNFNKFKQIGFIGLIVCLILNVPFVCIFIKTVHSSQYYHNYSFYSKNANLT